MIVNKPDSTSACLARTKRNRFRRFLAAVALPVAVMASTAGCHRNFYRKQADQEVNCLLNEKASHVVRSPNGRLDIGMDQRSRMYNPFDLDFQPMPTDDPSSHRYMQCVDGRRGYPMWDAAGFTNTNENPHWVDFLPLNEDGVLVLNNDTAVRLALLHSTEYQEQLETLYLSALDVSSERFQFDTQFYGGLDAEYRNVRLGDADSSTLSTGLFTPGSNGLGGRGLGFRRAFATGGELVAGIANSIVWQLSGPNTQSATTLLDFTLVQPLLRGAGRDRVLERLTLAERNLLANIRTFERYRRAFYLNVTIGRNVSNSDQVRRRGGVFGVGLQGFTGLGSGFAGLGGGGATGFGGGGGVPQAGGFLGLLQDQLQIKNQEENVARLTENLLLLENTLIELLTTIPDDPQEIVSQRLQIAQQRSSLISERSTLVGLKASYQSSVDNFMQNLGLPSYVCTKIEDPLLNGFELIDGDLRSRREELLSMRALVGQLNLALLEEAEVTTDEDTGLPGSTLEWSPRVEEVLETMRAELEPLRRFLSQLQNEDGPRVRQDIETFAKELPKRLSQNEQLIEIYERERGNICTLLNVDKIDESIFDLSQLKTLETKLFTDLEKLLGRLASFEGQVAEIDTSLGLLLADKASSKSPRELAGGLREDVILATQDLLSELADDVLVLQVMQAQARTEAAVLTEVDMDPATAFEIARRNRRDWANARASLVDSWRLIEFNADNLESILSLSVTGGIGNDGNNPFKLRGDNNRVAVGVLWDAPITRLQERNTYRQSLIEYEQAKRSYYQYEDGIWQLMRAQLRQLQVNSVNFEYGRQAVRIATSQIELNEDIRELRDARGLSSGPTAARDTIQALSDLRNAQNQLLNLYVNYEVVRRGLIFDLGTMELTPEGMWMDPGKIDADYLLSLEGTMTDGMIEGQCSECCLKLRQPPNPHQFNNALINEPVLMEESMFIEQLPMEQMQMQQPGGIQPGPNQPGVQQPLGQRPLGQQLLEEQPLKMKVEQVGFED